MASTSYVKAGLSCLPFVGSFVHIYNTSEIMPKLNAESFVFANLSLQGNTPAFHESRNKMINFYSECKTYSICALLGNALSVASLVSLVAFGILGAGIPSLLGCFYAVHSFYSYLCIRLANNRLELLNLPFPYLAGQPA